MSINVALFKFLQVTVPVVTVHSVTILSAPFSTKPHFVKFCWTKVPANVSSIDDPMGTSEGNVAFIFMLAPLFSFVATYWVSACKDALHVDWWTNGCHKIKLLNELVSLPFVLKFDIIL